MIQAFRFELAPNKRQESLLRKHAGAARFAYNWGLELVRTGAFKPNAIKLHKELCIRKKSEFRWMYEVSKCAPQEALRDLQRAFENFYAHRAKYPQFKRKGRDDSFRLTGSIKVVDSRHIQLPRIGKIRTKEKTDKFRGRVLAATVKREADRWYVSLRVELNREAPMLNQSGVVGIDCNIAAIVTTDEIYPLPKPLARNLRLLRRRSRQHSRKLRGSRNRQKSALRLARLHRRIRNIRSDFYHKLSSHLARTKQVIVAESLHIRGMLRSRLSRSIADAGWGMFVRMLRYKCQWYGAVFIEAPVFFPSSKRCSRCGSVKSSLSLSERVFRCEVCGSEIDRDTNAALNLQRYGLAHLTGPTGSSPGSNACGDPTAGAGEAPL